MQWALDNNIFSISGNLKRVAGMMLFDKLVYNMQALIPFGTFLGCISPCSLILQLEAQVLLRS